MHVDVYQTAVEAGIDVRGTHFAILHVERQLTYRMLVEVEEQTCLELTDTCAL